MDNFTLLLLTILLPLMTIPLLLLRRRRQTTTTPPPPSPTPLPIIGHLHLLTDMPHHSFARLARRLGPVFALRLGRVPTIVVSSARHAALVLKTHDHVFANRPQLVSAQYLSFNCSDVTFSRYGHYWRQARKICVTELLSQKRVNSFNLIRDEETNRMLSRIRPGTENDVSNLVFTVANDVLCRVAFGRRFIKEEGQKRHLTGVLAEAQELFGGFCAGDFFPEWGWVDWVTGFRSRCERSLNELREVCDEIIEEHLNSRKTTSSFDEEDFVDVLLRVQRTHDLVVPITDDNLKALVLDMFVAGTDTTFAIIEWTMTQLIRHPTSMRRAQEEVRKLAFSTGRVKEDHLQHLHYIRSVVKETMRLTPPVPLLVPRESLEDCTLDGYHIPAKTRVLINTYAIGRDPNSWENPLEFNPERFIGHNTMEYKEEDHFKFLPFGAGRRGCPGFTFGLATVELALARLLCHFDWALPCGVGIDDVDLEEIFGLAIRKKTPLVLVPTANKDFEFKGIIDY